MYQFTVDENNPIDVEGSHGFEYQSEIDEACVVQANLAGELLEALRSVITAADEVGPKTYSMAVAVVRAAIAKAKLSAAKSAP